MASLLPLAAGLVLAAWPSRPARSYPSQYFAGAWSCHPKHQSGFTLTFTFVEPHVHKDKKNIPTDHYYVLASGPFAHKLPATSAEYSADRGNSSVLFSGSGRCGAPAITDEDDEPTSGAPRCAQFEATGYGWEKDALSLNVRGTRISGKEYELTLLITRASAKQFTFAVRDGEKVLAEGSCAKRK